MSTLNRSVLVLNRDWSVIDTISVRKAICTVFRETANIVDSNFAEYSWEDWASIYCFDYEDEEKEYKSYINAGRFKIRTPEVMTLKSYHHVPPRSMPLTRRNLYIRDCGICQYTGIKISTSEATWDHVIPSSRGGKTNWENLVLCSINTNVKKGNKTPEEAGLTLLKKPIQPKWSPVYSVPKNKRPDIWKHFMSKDDWENGYWDVELQD